MVNVVMCVKWKKCLQEFLTSFTFSSQHAIVVLDATRISDGKQVALKKVVTAKHPDEAKIGNLLYSEPHASHPSNYCVPIYDVLTLPDEKGTVIMVMPFLYRWNVPEFDTIGEYVEFARQVFEVSEILSHDLRTS